MKSKRKPKPIIGPGPDDIWREARKTMSLKRMKRFQKPAPWVHFIKGEKGRGGFALCGKENNYRSHCGPSMVNSREFVTCPRCVEVLKKSHWWCPEHGFIDDINVTNDEKCETCGLDV